MHRQPRITGSYCVYWKRDDNKNNRYIAIH